MDASLRTSEIARLAETLLESGVYRTGYGLHVWRCTRPGTWRMDGLYGQFGIIVPDLGACISLTGHYEGSTGDILRAVWSEPLPALAAAA